MPRMFDILREKSIGFKETIRKNTDKNADATVSFPRQIRNSLADQEKTGEGSKEQERLIDAVKKNEVDNADIAKERYLHALGMAKALLERANRGKPFDVGADEICETVDILANQLILGNSLLENVAQDYAIGEYLPRHLVNVCILSLAVGIQMNLNKSKLHVLGMAAFLHDIGMVSVRNIIEQPRTLSYNELTAMRRHPAKGAEIIARAHNFDETIKGIIQQHHERVNGKGYPLGIKSKEINGYAKIIGLVDTYEAMTHRRPHRKAKMPHQAMREIIGPFKLFFKFVIIKALVDRISIYPVGSFVKLQKGEIAKVIAANPTSPLRPCVLILFDSNGKRMPEPITVDISKNNSIYIREPVSLKEEKM